MYSVRRWSVRHARLLETVYTVFERMLIRLHPLFARIGYQRLERPAAATERWIKGVLFDCRMCGHCILQATGMSCPMNCPKQMRNGPCGGVRPDGRCEIRPDMQCVWVDAWAGAARMRNGRRILELQPPLDRRSQGRSTWLQVARGRHGPQPAPPTGGNA